MLDLKFVRDNTAAVKTALENRGEPAGVIDDFSTLDATRRELLGEIEALRHQRNTVSDEIATMKKQGENADAPIAEMRRVSERIKALDEQLSANQEKVDALLMGIPNLPHESVPVGRDEADNVEIKVEGEPPAFGFPPQPHWTLGESLKILDFPRAAKLTGARFPLYIGMGARLERALINFMLDIHTTEHGYTECLPPFMVNRKTMTGTGQLPKFEEDLFKLDKWDYYLIPTAEVPVTNIYQDEILSEADFPLKYTAFTPCFRSEAGSYGKDTKGLIRQHQFNKVELVKFTLPENSYDELEKLLADAETILKRLELPYRVITLCTGDIGFSAAKTYDIEVWFPAQQKYREISSCSNFESFQARRANIRFKRKDQKGTELVHTLNGSGLAVGRTLAALLENRQEKDGSVSIPEALQPYMNSIKKMSP
ncbi:MAG: serine--tRNA ligase [Thermodesulfobacteriota bacterium]|nr:serine--tRNA ligase [Thermodesulfobacteriota bacterium]